MRLEGGASGQPRASGARGSGPRGGRARNSQREEKGGRPPRGRLEDRGAKAPSSASFSSVSLRTGSDGALPLAVTEALGSQVESMRTVYRKALQLCLQSLCLLPGSGAPKDSTSQRELVQGNLHIEFSCEPRRQHPACGTEDECDGCGFAQRRPHGRAELQRRAPQ
ncbi:hypothetical protein NN561_019780 [Cricetulus griseus]